MENLKSEAISLEILLSSPFVWSPLKCADFIRTVHRRIVEDSRSELRQKLDTDYINDLSPKWRLWPVGSSWKDVFKENCNSIISMEFNINGRVSKKSERNENEKASLVKLVRIIRNIMEHTRVYRDNMYELNWFRKVDSIWEFDISLFLNYWNQRFPQLLPYLWWKYWNSKDLESPEDPKIANFYPYDLGSLDLIQLLEFPQNIKQALETRLGLGTPDDRDTLELRALQNDLIQNLLGGSSYLEIEISEKSVSCKWYSKLGNDYKVTNNRVTCMNWGKETDILTLYIGNKICHISWSNAALKSLKEEENKRRIIIFVSISSYFQAYEKIEIFKLAQYINWLRTGSIMEIPSACNDSKEKTCVATKWDKYLVLNGVQQSDEFVMVEPFHSFKDDFLNSVLRKHAKVFLERRKLVKYLKDNFELQFNMPNLREYLREHLMMESIRLGNNTEMLTFLEEKYDSKLVMFIEYSESLFEWLAQKHITVNGQLLDYSVTMENCIKDDFFSSFTKTSKNEHFISSTLTEQQELLLFSSSKESDSDLMTFFIKYLCTKAMEQKYLDSCSVNLTNFHFMHNCIPRPLSNKPILDVNSTTQLQSQTHFRTISKTWCHINLSCTDTEIKAISCQRETLKRMLANLFINELNLDCNEKYNITDLYDQMIDKKLETFLREKKGVKRKNVAKGTMFNTLRFMYDLTHVYYSLKLIMGDEIADKFRDLLILTQTNDEELGESTLEVGIVENLLPLTFIHRTFAEYFIARFAYNVITHQIYFINESDTVFQEFFYDEMLATQSITEYESYCKCFQRFKYPDICYFYDEIWSNEMITKSPQNYDLFKRGVRDLSQKTLWHCELSKIAPFLSAAIRLGFPAFLDVLLRSPRLTLEIINSAMIVGKFEFLEYAITNKLGLFQYENWHKLIQLDNNGNGQLDTFKCSFDSRTKLSTKLRELFSYLSKNKYKNMALKMLTNTSPQQKKLRLCC